jgi:hypothetical protein
MMRGAFISQCTTPSSDGQDGRLSAQCDSQPEDLLRRDDVDAQCNSAAYGDMDR